MKVKQLKIALLIGWSVVSLNFKGMAQETKYKVIKKSIESEVMEVSADSLWAICREFDKTAEWTSTLKHSYGSGTPIHEGASCSARTCVANFGKGKKVVEELILFSDKNKELSYNLIEGAPGFIKLANNHWQIIEVGPYQSKIIMHLSMHMKRSAAFFWGRLISLQAEKKVKLVQKELKIYAETGEVSEAKKKQLKKTNKITE